VAYQIIQDQTIVGAKKTVNIKDSLGLVLAQSIYSEEQFPPFPASIMDGYAVIAEDCPGELAVIGVVTAGDSSKIEVSKGVITRIMTGAPIPKGANAVVKVEDTEVVSKENGEEKIVKISVGTKPGQFIRPIGSDIQIGQLIISAGDIIGATEIGLLASLGINEISVFSSPIVAVLSTGNELVDPDKKPIFGQIRDSNRIMLLSALSEEKIKHTIDLGIAIDSREELEKAIIGALTVADILITSGGVSMGELDLLKPILEKLGKIHFGRILMKPGKPLTFATIELNGAKKLVFGLPGNPVSSMACFKIFCVPALRKASGFKEPNHLIIQVKISDDLKLDPERPEYLRATTKWTNEGYVAQSTGSQQSSRLLSFRSANTLLMLPQGSGVLSRGDTVQALVIGQLI